MSKNLDGIIIPPPEEPNGSVIRVERVWQYRHDIELKTPKPRHSRSVMLALGAGGLLLGAICIFVYSDPGRTDTAVLEEAMASYPAAPDNAVVLTKLRDIVDTTPAPIKSAVTDTREAPLPYMVIPTKRPVLESVKSGGPEKAKRVTSATSAADAIHYNRCKLGCETRDPLIVGTVPVRISTFTGTVSSETPEIDRRNGTVEIGKAALNGAGFVLIQTAALPFTALKLGRNVAVTMSELD